MLLLKKGKATFWISLFFWLAVIYSPTVKAPFVLDDLHTIPENPAIQTPVGAVNAWLTGRTYSSLPSNYGYRPMTTATTVVLWQIAGGATWPYHVFKIVLMWVCCLLLFKLWWALFASTGAPYFEEVSYVAIALFAVNPVHTQVVSYIATTATQLAAVFALSSVLSYVRFRKFGRPIWLVISIVCLALSTLSKEEGVASLAFLVLVEIFLRLREQRSREPVPKNHASRFLWIHILTAAACVWLIFQMYEPTQGLVRSEIIRSDYFLTQIRAWVRYLWMYILALDLNFDNLQFGFSHSFSEPQVVVAALLNMALVGVAVRTFKTTPWVAFSVAWFYAGLAPASSVVVLSEPVNDHRAFLGYLGLSLFGLFGLCKLRMFNQKAFLAATFVVAVVYSGMTLRRSYFWTDSAGVWAETLRQNPESPRAINNFAFEKIKQKKFAEALPLLDHCIGLNIGYANCFMNRGVANVGLGREAEALQDFETAVRVDRTVLASHLTLARHLLARGYYDRPKALLTEADAFVNGHDLETRLALIDLLASYGHAEEAAALVRESRPAYSGQSQFEAEASKVERLTKP